MTEPEPTPEPQPELTGPALDQAISDAGKDLTAELLAHPRNQQRLDDARTELLRLRALRDAQA